MRYASSRSTAGLCIAACAAFGATPATSTARAAPTGTAAAQERSSPPTGTPAGKSREVRADFDGNGHADLAVGAPKDTVPGLPGEWHGTVSVLYGSSRGVTDHDQLWHRGSPGVKGVPSGIDARDPGECCWGAFGDALL